MAEVSSSKAPATETSRPVVRPASNSSRVKLLGSPRRRPTLAIRSRAMAIHPFNTAHSAAEADWPHLHVARDEWGHPSTVDGHQAVTWLRLWATYGTCVGSSRLREDRS